MASINSSGFTRALWEYAQGADREYSFRLRRSSEPGLIITNIGVEEVQGAGQMFIDNTPPGNDPEDSQIAWDGDPVEVANSQSGAETVNAVIAYVRFETDWRVLGACLFDPVTVQPGQSVSFTNIIIKAHMVTS